MSNLRNALTALTALAEIVTFLGVIIGACGLIVLLNAVAF